MEGTHPVASAAKNSPTPNAVRLHLLFPSTFLGRKTLRLSRNENQPPFLVPAGMGVGAM